MTLYLTKTERALYNKLPASVKKVWGGNVEEETGTAWETEEQLRERAEHLKKTMSPRLCSALEIMSSKVEKKGLDALSFEDIPPAVFPKAMLMLGAVGITTVIDFALQGARISDDLTSLAGLSDVRHQILLSNSLVFQQ